MSEINGSIVKERFQTIETLINSKSANFRDSIKQPLKVLVEKRGNSGLFEGYDQYFYPVYIESSNSLEGQYIEIKDYNWRDFQDV
jgi:tRNA A37 methylthiotransferase MiaB